MDALLSMMGGGASGSAPQHPAGGGGKKRKRQKDGAPGASAPDKPSTLWSVTPTTLSGARGGAPLPLLRRLCRRAFRQQAYWKPADRPPANVFERLADQVFWQHAEAARARMEKAKARAQAKKQQPPGKKLKGKAAAAGAAASGQEGGAVALDLSRCGAEWWVQVRGPRMEQGTSLGFHWDLDYAKGTCPAVATVTYLTDRGGAPTVVFDAAASYRALNPRPPKGGGAGSTGGKGGKGGKGG